MQRMNPFKLPLKAAGEFEKLTRKQSAHKPLQKLEVIAQILYKIIAYDYTHDYKGTRTASTTLVDQKGHCMEINTALYACAARILPEQRANMFWLVAKNPRGYQNKSLSDVGIHPFLGFRWNDKEYCIDAVAGNVMPYKPEGFAIVTQRMSNREFIALTLQYGGEDIGIAHKDPLLALNWLGGAQRVDPNNYTIDIMGGDMFTFLNREAEAERAYRQAIKIAPRALEPFASYAEFLEQFRSREDSALRMYELALMKETMDIQVLSDVEQGLARLGASRLQKKARRMLEALLRTPHYITYFKKN